MGLWAPSPPAPATTLRGGRGHSTPGRYDEHMRLPDIPLALLASARLSRLLVTDDLGRWWVKEPLARALTRYADREEVRARYEHREPVEPWWWRYHEGVDCPWCSGFWLGAAVLIGYRVLPLPLWRLTTGALAMNYAATHLGITLGDFDNEEHDDE